MVLSKSELKLILTSIFVLATFLGLIRVLSTYQGSNFFPLEVVGIVMLLGITLGGYVTYNTLWGERLFMLMYLLALVNFLVVWYFKDAFHIVLVLVTIVGFIFAIPTEVFRPATRQRQGQQTKLETYYDNTEEQPHSQIFEENVKRLNSTEPFGSFVFETKEEKKTQHKGPATKITTKTTTPAKATTSKVTLHSPGKYLASKYGNTYHEPRCEWAKKINKSHQVWFAAKENAWEKGYKAHDCVK